MSVNEPWGAPLRRRDDRGGRAARRPRQLFRFLPVLPLALACQELQAPSGQVASVQLLPETTSVIVGQVADFSATPRDAQGNPVLSVPVSWATGDPTIAVAYAAGRVAALDTGTTTVVASSEGHDGQARMHVHPLPGIPWPNEPPGFSLISEQPWTLLDALGWFTEFGVTHIGLDSTAPLSPPFALQVDFPVGFVGGSAPGTMTHALPNVRQLYVGLWWKASDPWQGHNSNVNKIQYVFTNATGSMFMAMYGSPGGPYELRVFPQLTTSNGQWLLPNVATVPVTVGAWHRIEWLIVYNTTTNPANGIVRWWLDGLLIGDHEDVLFPDDPMSYYKMAPVWGGVGDTKTEADYFRYDQVHLSGR